MINMRLVLLIRFLALMTIAVPTGISSARELDETQTIPILQFRTYNSGWLRFYNHDEDGDLKLAADISRILPFQLVVSPIPLGRTELGNAGTIATLIAQRRLFTKLKRIDGQCDIEKLHEKGTDLLCVPGSSILPIGYVLLALYHPEGHEIVALTTTIDNSTGRANPADSQTEAAGCGPYVPGQWIKEADYVSSGLDLPINREHVGHLVTDYQCIAPENGARPYLQAYRVTVDESRGDDDSGNSPTADSCPLGIDANGDCCITPDCC